MDGLWPTFIRRKQIPPADKSLTIERPSDHYVRPEKVTIPLQDIASQPYEVFVKVGDTLAAGQKIGITGREDNFIAVHASIPGQVADIGHVLNALQEHVMSVTITTSDDKQTADHIPFSLSGISDPSDFFRNMGLPLDYNCFGRCSTLLVNATEFEPCFTSTHRLVIEETDKLAEGLGVLLKAYGASKAIIAVEKNEISLHEHIRHMSAKISGLSVQEVARPYPVTIGDITRQYNQAAGDGSTVVVDPGLLAAAYDAYVQGIPFTRQLITVCGSGIANPGNLWVPCGTLIADIINFTGGDLSTIGRVSFGGPMMGIPQQTPDVPVVKNLRGIFAAAALVFEENHHSRFYQQCDCVRCGKCVDVCPADLQPHRITELVEFRYLDDAVALGLFSCLECGLCYFVCPSQIPLSVIIKLGKVTVKGKESLLVGQHYKSLLTITDKEYPQ